MIGDGEDTRTPPRPRPTPAGIGIGTAAPTTEAVVALWWLKALLLDAALCVVLFAVLLAARLRSSDCLRLRYASWLRDKVVPMAADEEEGIAAAAAEAANKSVDGPCVGGPCVGVW